MNLNPSWSLPTSYFRIPQFRVPSRVPSSAVPRFEISPVTADNPL